MHFVGDLSKTSKWELLHLKEVPYWHRAGSGIQEAFNRMHAAGKRSLDKMDTGTIEVWTTTMLALAMQHRERKDFWLGKPKNDPPDMAVMTITEKGYFHARELEVTRCINPDEELISNILKKDQENILSEKYILCGFVEVPGKYDLMQVGRDLQNKLVNIKNVVLVFHGVGLEHVDDEIDLEKTKNFWTVAQISPVFDAITLDIADEYKKWLDDPGKLVYTEDGRINFGKRNHTDPYPTLLTGTPLQI